MLVRGYDPDETLNSREAVALLGTTYTTFKQMYRDWGVKFITNEENRLVFFRSDLEKQMAERPRKAWRNCPAWKEQEAA